MKNKYLLIAFLALCVFQIAAPFYKMHRTYRTLQQGEAFLFDVAPLDPYDAFRGRYVTIAFQLDSIFTTDTLARSHHFIALYKRQNGAAVFGRLQAEPFADGVPYIRLKERWREGNYIKLGYPIERFYMNEFDAPRADSLLQDPSLHIQAKVKVLKGEMAIEQLFVNQIPIVEYLRRH